MNRYLITFECEETKGTFVAVWQDEVVDFESIAEAVLVFGHKKSITINKDHIIILLFCKLNTDNQ